MPLQELQMQMMCWMAETPLKYVSEGKRGGTASAERYERYSKAVTVGEALALGSTKQDFVNDVAKGLLKITGGPVREKPLEMEELLSGDGLTDTDRTFGGLAKRFHRANLANKLDIHTKTADTQRSWCESPEMHVKRIKAQETAEAILAELDEHGHKATDAQVLKMLRQWAFRRNKTRGRVAPVGMPFVDSDTFGIMQSVTGQWLVTRATSDYPAVTKLLLRWLRDILPTPDFSCTSIHVNSGFAARRHRDHQNLGPTVMRAIGEFTGGQLWYWPEDDGKAALEQLPDNARISLDVHKAAAVIDGNRAHEIEPYEGDRFGIVFFTASNCHEIPTEMADDVASYGFKVLDEAEAAAAGQLFPAPKGYGLEPAPRPHKQPIRKEKDAMVSKKQRICRTKKSSNNPLLVKLLQASRNSSQGAKDESAKKALKVDKKYESKSVGVLKPKTKASLSGGLLARMLAKRSQQHEDTAGAKSGGGIGLPKVSAASRSALPPTAGAAAPAAAEPGVDGSNNSKHAGLPGALGKLLPGGLLARVIENKKAKKTKEAVTAAFGTGASADGSGFNTTPPRKRPCPSSAAPTGTESAKKQKAPGADGAKAPGASEAKRAGGSNAAITPPPVAAQSLSAPPAAAASTAAAPSVSPSAADPPAATPPVTAPPVAAPAVTAPPVASPAVAVTLATTPAVVTPVAALLAAEAAGKADAGVAGAGAAARDAVSATTKAVAAALGLSTEPSGRDAVLPLHFLPFVNVLRAAAERPASAVTLLADYLQVLLETREQPEQLLRAVLNLLVPAEAAPAEVLTAAVTEAFGATAGRTAQEKGFAEAAHEGRRNKRSLRAPPPRLTLIEASETLEASKSSDASRVAEAKAMVVRALGASRTEGMETLFFAKLLQGTPSLDVGTIHSAVARAVARVLPRC